MKKWENYTLIFLGVFIAAIVVFDVIAIYEAGTEGTLSFNITDMAHRFPMLPFAFGVLTGHLFWRTRDTENTDKWGR